MCSVGDDIVDGVWKVIDELGKTILAKEVKIESQQKEIIKLKNKIEAIECYIDSLEDHINTYEPIV